MSRIQYESISDFVRQNNGSKVIKRILIANNGNAAIKAIRSMRSWAYKTFGNEKEIEFVVMATIEDIEANAEYITEADYLHEVPSGTNNNNFANVALIVQIAEEHECDAVWPGWGHASENFELPLALSKARRPIAWIGPRPSSMLALGDKIGSTIIAQSAGVPCVPWSGSNVSLPDDFNCLEELPTELLNAACVKSAEDVHAACKRIGFPVMVKASEGGGGKGIRKVTCAAEIDDAFRQVVNEVKGSPVFVMKMVSRCRHLEVQIFADEHGFVTSLGTRDCSIQRRSQKIIEEGNVVAAPPEVVKAMEDAAVRLAKKVGYSNAGTAEFLYDAETKEVYFCEVNARLQVEHVVTEVVDDLNLPAAQLQVAMGLPMSQIVDVSRFIAQRENGTLPPRHCIACRVTAEHAEEGFRPTCGAVHEISFRSSSKVWGYFCIGAPGRIHAYADSQFGHIFSVGETREDAIGNMLAALKNLTIRGEIRTNVEALMAILVADDFVNLRTHTTWLEQSVAFSTPLLARRVQHSTLLAVMLAATFEASEFFHKSRVEFSRRMSQGQLPPALELSTEIELVYKAVKFSVGARESGPNSVALSLNGSEIETSFRHVSSSRDGGFLVSGGFDGRTRQVFRKLEPQGVSVTFEGATYSFTRESDPTQVRAPMSGKLVRWLVAPGSECETGTAYCEIEIMKMYMQLHLEHAGTITHVLSEGAVFASGDLLATLALPNGATPPKVSLFAGQFPPAHVGSSSISNLLSLRRNAEKRLADALAGYAVPRSIVEDALDAVRMTLFNGSLAGLELREILSVLGSQMPEGLKKAMNEILTQTLSKAPPSEITAPPLPVTEITTAMENQLTAQNKKDYSGPTITRTQLQPLIDLLRKYHNGVLGAACSYLSSILTIYFNDETLFASSIDPPAKTLLNKRTELTSDRAVELIRSHSANRTRAELVRGVLSLIRRTEPLVTHLDKFRDPLASLASLTKLEYAPVASAARQLQLTRIAIAPLPLENRISQLTTDISTALKSKNPETALENLLTGSPRMSAECDALLTLCGASDPMVRKAAFSLLVRILYCSRSLQNVRVRTKGDTWENTHDSDKGLMIARMSSFENLLMRAGASSNQSLTPLVINSSFMIGVFLHAPLIDSKCLADLKKLSTSTTGIDLNSSDVTCQNNVSGLSGIDSRLAQMLLDPESNSNGADASATQETIALAFTSVESFTTDFAAALEDIMLLKRDSLLDLVSSRALLITLSAQLPLTALATCKEVFNNAVIARQLSELLINVVSIASLSPEAQSSSDSLVTPSCVAWNHFGVAPVGTCIYEEPLLTNADPSACTTLELSRLSNFAINRVRTTATFVHLFEANVRDGGNGRRFFVRVPVRAVETGDKEVFAEMERYFCEALNTLENSIRASRAESRDGNHLLISMLSTPGNPSFRFSPAVAESAVRTMYNRYENRLKLLRVQNIEFRYPWATTSDLIQHVRLLIDNPTNQSVRSRKALEVTHPTSGLLVLASFDSRHSDPEIDGVPALSPHALAGALARKRGMAAAIQTVYIYDFITLLEQAIKDSWTAAFGESPRVAPFMPEVILEAVELILGSRGQLEEASRAPGMNSAGMVAWMCTAYTPEFPKGRRFVLIGNDCTYMMGTFGVQEDLIFQRASELARREGIPRIFLACNSGARMGLATEVMQSFRVEWVDAADPPRGFKFLYLTPEDHARLKITDSVVTELVSHPELGDIYKITDIIGAEAGLGVENLCGSGAIAGETSKAYKETFTLTYVTGRNVGIGAYITRLGQRVIQKVSGAPILLTGYQALNRLVGRDVYSSNDEIGGVDVMHRNGVTHEVVNDDLNGCKSIIRWLSFIPDRKGGALPVIPSLRDPPTRVIGFKPSSSTDDPRMMLTGCTDATGNWQGGLLDKDSFVEYMSEWAKSVIVGRGRLGGYPLGVITVETRVTEARQPADPAAPQTSEQTQLRAGQVWYPDSAFKTAQAINDFNHEELPLLMLANWRGFSGGQRDMFLEILKFGSYIVDALVDFKQPCIVYIPPKGELRGGAWVVVDSRINPDSMELFADVEARGGVLEPTGTVEIKFRDRQLIEVATRTDEKLIMLSEQEKKLIEMNIAVDAPERLDIKEKRERRLSELMPVYKQVALHFADLHDTSVRMKRKHAISEAVYWQQARQFFFWRLRRQLILFSLRSELVKAVPSMSLARAERVVLQWAEESGGDAGSSPSSGIESSTRFVQWAKMNIQQIYSRIQAVRHGYIRLQVSEMCRENPTAVWQAISEVDSNAVHMINQNEIAGFASLLQSISSGPPTCETENLH